MNEQRNIEYASCRCFECGTYWAIETWRNHSNPKCPRCASIAIRRANERADAAERSRNALRGAFNKLKRSR